MKKAFTKALAILLATLMLLGACAAGAAAAPIKQNRKDIPQMAANKAPKSGAPLAASVAEDELDAVEEGALEIITPGTITAKLYYNWWYDSYELAEFDLAGLVLQAEGGRLGAPATVDCAVVTTEESMKPEVGKTVWYFYLGKDSDAYPDGWETGTNQAILHVQAFTYTEFVAEKEIDGVEYGKFNWEYAFWGQVPVICEASDWEYDDNDFFTPDYDGADELFLDEPAQANVPAWEGDWWDETSEGQWFKFTPEAGGLYRFKSDGAVDGETLWTEDGEEHVFDEIDPVAVLFDENGGFVAYNDDRHGMFDRNFMLYANLDAGKTYYLYCTTYDNPGGAYTVTVEAYAATLAAVKKITVNFHQFVDLSGLLTEGNTWDFWDLSFRSSGKAIGSYWWDDIFWGAKRGTGYIIITAPDGASARVEVTVKYTTQQWLSVIFLGGWGWMKYTRIGEPFSLKIEWALLRDYGILNALGDLAGNFFYTVSIWFENLAYWFW